MAFNPLTEAECGQKNPLARLASHVTQDHAFAAETHGHLFPTGNNSALVDDFLQETKTLPQTYRMDDLMREMQEIESQRSLVPPVRASTVKDQLHDESWARQYIQDGKAFQDNTNFEGIWEEKANKHRSPQTFKNGSYLRGDEFGRPFMPPAGISLFPFANSFGYNNQLEGQRLELNSAYKAIWEDIDAQEAILNDKSSLINHASTSGVGNETKEEDDQFVYSKFMKFMDKVGDGKINLEDAKLREEEATSWSQEYLDKSTENKAENANDDKNAEAAAASTVQEGDVNSKFWQNLQNEFKQSMDADQDWLSEYENFASNLYTEYNFTEDNPMFDVPNPLERGKQLLEEGDLPSAVLCFEAAVKQEPDNAEAWLLLGKTQAENEQDPHAIPALKKCLEIDPNQLAAMMALAVSYTNESYYSQAAQVLVKWLANNPKYGDLVPPDFKITGQVTSFLNPDQHNAIQELFIKAAQRQPNDIDHDVQCCLGVLFNLSGEYDKAADCFRAALNVQPDDAKLWNRLGATLANGYKSEEAVEAYHRALNLEPGFIRARYNVGIICINLRAYKEAAEHFLTALNQQARGRNVKNSQSENGTQMSDSIWSTLRMCLSLGDRSDLKAAVDSRDLDMLNKAFDFEANSTQNI